jgi:CubicO group peptidase (beta-lactamase class C family)
MTAKGIARHYAALVGEVDGVRLLSPKTLARALETPRTGEPESALRGLGYMLHGPDNNRASAFGHGGAGGSLGLADVRGQLAIGIAKNRMGTSACETTSAAEQIVQEIRNAVGAWLA